MNQEFEQNPYATPASQLQQPASGPSAPGIEEALARGYNFSVDGLINEAWRLVKGSKGTLIAGAIVYFVAVNLTGFVLGFILSFAHLAMGGAAPLGNEALEVSVGVISSALCSPLLVGLNMIGIRRAAGQPATINEIFVYFSRFTLIFLTALAVSALFYLGILLLLLPGIYLGVAYALAVPLVAERGLSPWQAMEASRKAISQHWFKVFGLFFTLGLMLLLSAIPLGIGLVWTLPLAFIAIGVLYRTIFGVLPPAN
jgi:uncharacterized membrane protein